jgi:hypothetical protein
MRNSKLYKCPKCDNADIETTVGTYLGSFIFIEDEIICVRCQHIGSKKEFHKEDTK